MLKLDGTVKCNACGMVYALAGNQCNVSGCPECGSHSWTISMFEPNLINPEGLKQESNNGVIIERSSGEWKG